MHRRKPDGEPSTAAAGSVLILEDDDDIRHMLQRLLQQAGYAVVACASGAEALTMLQRGARVCLILLDLMMPGINGFQFRAEQRANPELRDIPVVVMTGVARPRDYHGNLRAVGYLQKPFDIEQILALVRRHCT